MEQNNGIGYERKGKHLNREEKLVIGRMSRGGATHGTSPRSWERGSNENVNRIIRRFIAKGRKIEKFTRSCVSTIENWINSYPRKILNFKSAHDLFQHELQKVAA